MPTIVRNAQPKRERKKRESTAEDVQPKRIKRPPAEEAVTERMIWDLRQQIAGCLQKIDELETKVYKLAYGGKEKEFYTVEEAAEIWGMSKSALYLMIKDGRLPAVKIGDKLRISKATILRGTK
ncbi:MAG: helix-turn-helix domain-containing protein [Anaerolineaceae bacterium]|nr:helix-turn-helix domain-containing protein [Anaerolineaceae bacterium]